MERVERHGLAFNSQTFPHISSGHKLDSFPFDRVVLAGLMPCIISTYTPCLTQAFVATSSRSGFFPLHHQSELLHPVFRQSLGSKGPWVKPLLVGSDGKLA